MVRYFLNNNSAVCKVQIHVRVLYKSKFVVKFCQMMLLCGCIYLQYNNNCDLLFICLSFFFCLYWNLFALIFYQTLHDFTMMSARERSLLKAIYFKKIIHRLSVPVPLSTRGKLFFFRIVFSQIDYFTNFKIVLPRKIFLISKRHCTLL